MHLFLFINYIGGVSQKNIGGSLVICKRNFYNQFKKIIWEKFDWDLWYFCSRDLYLN